LDLTRKNARNHMAFGGGIHRCTGASLSKCELELVHSSIWKRLPNLALAVPAAEIPYYDEGSVYGVRSVPLVWGH
jgi:cytochrome P450